MGCFGFDVLAGEDVATGPIIRIDPGGQAEVVAEGLYFPNGMIVDGTRLIVAETLGNRLSVFDVAANGTLGERRDWARFGDLPTASTYQECVQQVNVAADGISQPDAEDAVWVADAANHRAVRVAEGGEILEDIQVDPPEHVYATALGGPDGHTLHLASAPGFGVFDAAQRQARLLATRVNVPLRS